METMGPPISSQPWSSDFVAQTLEVLPVALTDAGLCWMKPVHADSLRVGLGPRSKPHETVLEVLKWYPLEPVVVHSTSWRHEGGSPSARALPAQGTRGESPLEIGRVILTYIAVVQAPASLPADSLVTLPVHRADLARGSATAAPKTIGVEAVLEHAMRHLSWLVKDDPAIMETLPAWKDLLAGFQPEPFRAL